MKPPHSLRSLPHEGARPVLGRLGARPVPIITSLLDTDLYKFTMWQAMLHRHPQT